MRPPQAGEGDFLWLSGANVFIEVRLRTRQEFVVCQNGCVDASSSGVYWAFISPFRRYATPSPASGGRDFVPGGFVHDRNSSLVKAGVSMLRQAVFIGLLFPPSVATRHLPPQAGEGILCQAASYTTGIRRLSKRVCRCFVKRCLLGFYSPFRRYATSSPASGGRDFVPSGHRCLHLSKVVKMAVKTKETPCFLAGEPRLGFVVQVASCVLRGKHTRGEGVSAERTMESWTSRYFYPPPSLRGISRYPYKNARIF